MRYFIAWVIFFLANPVSVFAGNGEYAVSKIPLALLTNADAITRLEEIKFEIISTKETRISNHYVITILNEKGDKYAEFREHYDQFTQIQSVDGALYDANGKQLKRIKRKDVEDYSAVSEISLMDDSRVKRHNFYYKQYPYTIEYEVVITNTSTLFFPPWTPQGGEGLAVEHSSYSLVTPEDYHFRYKAFNYKDEPIRTKERKTTVSTWSAQNLPAIKREPFSVLWHELSTMVIFGPGSFQVDNYKGNMSSWQDFGKFINLLKSGRDKLPDPIKQKVHELTDAVPDKTKRIEILYRYLQQHTRYINIALGIGGWQPFDAAYVSKNGYGDCKALSNYMYSLLKEAGISSFYTVIRAGDHANYITEDFPSQQFNHIILCVPLEKDTVWLECTSQTLPAGYLSSFTADRPALLIDENGGKLVRTPKYTRADNKEIRKATGSVDGNGTLKLHTITRYSAEEQDDLHDMINYLSRDKLKEYLDRKLDFATYDITDFNYEPHPDRIPVMDEALGITVSNYATITGRRLYVLPNVINRSAIRLAKAESRITPIVLGKETYSVDSIEIDLPEGYSVELLPKDVSLSGKFGKFESSVKIVGAKMMYYRKLEKYAGRFPASEYLNLATFYETIFNADHARIVLVKTN